MNELPLVSQSPPLELVNEANQIDNGVEMLLFSEKKTSPGKVDHCFDNSPVRKEDSDQDLSNNLNNQVGFSHESIDAND